VLVRVCARALWAAGCNTVAAGLVCMCAWYRNCSTMHRVVCMLGSVTVAVTSHVLHM
jgi:hypothetical protein